MYHDFYAYYQVKNEQDIDHLINGAGKYSDVVDVYQRILLLSTTYHNGNIDIVNHARSGLKTVLHSCWLYNQYIQNRLNEIKLLGMDSRIDVTSLPEGSWVLEFQIELEKPFLSMDDVPLYIINNPLKKDNVFALPFTSTTTWKGNLRWKLQEPAPGTKIDPHIDRRGI